MFIYVATCLSLALYGIFQTFMACYSQFVLKIPLNTNQRASLLIIGSFRVNFTHFFGIFQHDHLRLMKFSENDQY